MTNKLLLLTILTTLFAFGCRNEDPILITNIEDEFFIDFWENLEPNERTFQINMRTINNQSCLNYYIDYNAAHATNSTVLTLNNVELDGSCETGYEPASASYTFNRDLTGVYDIKINIQDAIVNPGIITITNDKYTVEMEKEDGIEIVRYELNRVPASTLWGFISYESENENLSNAIIENVEEFTKNGVQFDEGYYGYFAVDTNNAVEVKNKTKDFPLSTSFIYNYDSSRKENLRNILNEYANSDKVQIYIMNDQGELLSE